MSIRTCSSNSSNYKYSKTTKDAIKHIINTYYWAITDDGLARSIPGYNILILLGVLGVIGIYVAQKNRIKKDY